MHVKTSGGFACGAFFLSFLIGLVGGAGFPMLLVRALVFALFSFALSEAIYLVAKRFLIDSPVAADKETRPAGSQVNLSVEDDSGAEPAETAVIMDRTPAGDADSPKPVAAASGVDGAAAGGVLSDEGLLLGALPASEALDAEAKSVLAETADGRDAGAAAGADSSEVDSSPPAFGAMDMLFPNTTMPLKDVKLPDMEHMTDAFAEKKEEESFEAPPRKHTGKAVETLGKNYDPAKAANAIKTLLQRK